MMDDLRLAAVAARVVAWHNRHPLARRIALSHVHAVGYVGLPFAGAVGAVGAVAPPAAAAAPQAPAARGDDTEMGDLGALEAGAGEAGSLRERALARARQQAAGDAGATAPAGATGVAPPAADAVLPALATLLPDFSEDFIDPLQPRAVARFAARSGQVLARAPGDGPVREVPADGAHPGRQPARVYLLTAVIETGTRKSRVLLGTGLAAPVLGQRIFDTPRVAALGALAALVVGVPAWVLQPADAPRPPPQAAASAVDFPASQAAAPAVDLAASRMAAPAVDLPAPQANARASGPPASDPPASAAVAGGVLAAAPAASGALATADVAAAVLPIAPASALAGGLARSPVAKPVVSTGGAPPIRPVISDEDKARARQARDTLLASRQTAAPAAPEAPAPVGASAEDPAPAPPLARARSQPAPPTTAALPAPGATAFALSTRPLRTRAEAEQVQVAMRSLLRTVGTTAVKVDVLPQGDDWRVVALPFPQRAAADKARALLVSRGMRVEVIDF